MARTDKPFLPDGAKIGVAPEHAPPILCPVKGCYRFRALAVCLVFVAALFSGCGGFNGSHTVSPATILLPGLLKADPVPPSAPGTPTNRVASSAAATRSVAMADRGRVTAH